METIEQVKAQIRSAFALVEYPADWCLTNSRVGIEPLLLEQEFKGKKQWETIDPSFLDGAPNGYASALSFFSDAAFRFYLPAYLIADLDGSLQLTNPVFHLTHGLESSSQQELINPRFYGDRTWWDYVWFKFSVFTMEQVGAIVAYLRWKRESAEVTECDREQIDEALENYWNRRLITPANSLNLPS
jgi:hypothetical protein